MTAFLLLLLTFLRMSGNHCFGWKDHKYYWTVKLDLLHNLSLCPGWLIVYSYINKGLSSCKRAQLCSIQMPTRWQVNRLPQAKIEGVITNFMNLPPIPFLYFGNMAKLPALFCKILYVFVFYRNSPNPNLSQLQKYKIKHSLVTVRVCHGHRQICLGGTSFG